MFNNINDLEEIARFIEKIKLLSQQKINDLEVFNASFKLLENFKNNIKNWQQQLHNNLKEIKERLVNYQYNKDGDSLQDSDQLKKIELYLEQLANIMINDYLVINYNCAIFLFINNDVNNLETLFNFNNDTSFKMVEKLIIEGNIEAIKLLDNITGLKKFIDNYNNLLHATNSEQIDILKYLLEISINKKRINDLNKAGLTLLTFAITNNKLAAVKVY